jgi:hypothetical protein
MRANEGLAYLDQEAKSLGLGENGVVRSAVRDEPSEQHKQKARDKRQYVS